MSFISAAGAASTDGETITAPLPDTVNGHFGRNCAASYSPSNQAQATVPRLVAVA
jgi:hypothetical protein